MLHIPCTQKRSCVTWIFSAGILTYICMNMCDDVCVCVFVCLGVKIIRVSNSSFKICVYQNEVDAAASTHKIVLCRLRNGTICVAAVKKLVVDQKPGLIERLNVWSCIFNHNIK